jgi:hypothetical protein
MIQGRNPKFNVLYDLVENNHKEPWAKKVEDGVNKKLLNQHYQTRDATKVRRKKQQIIINDGGEVG